MTIRELINKLIEHDPSLQISFIKCRKKKANDYLSFIDLQRDSDGYVDLCLQGNEQDDQS